ncbi:Uncharacterised protein (plasmid) [Escherichia coli]|nr:Uncharacterised protein [Escherichia coli]
MTGFVRFNYSPVTPYVASIPGFTPSRALPAASPSPVHNSI